LALLFNRRRKGNFYKVTKEYEDILLGVMEKEPAERVWI
jgi:hypothetical protein